MSRMRFNIDERSRGIAIKLMSYMYVFSVLFLMVTLFYKQFVLHQPLGEYEEYAVLLVINVVFLLSAFLYFGVLPFEKFSITKIVFGYLVFVLLGFAFTYIKYTFLTEHPLPFGDILDKLTVIIFICGLFTFFFSLFAYLGKRKVDKELGQ